MTYPAVEASVQDGAPVLLFLLTQGDLVWRYTSATYKVEHLGEDFLPTPVSIGGITQSSDMARDVLSLKFPRGHEFAKQFLNYSPDQVTSVTLFRTHTTDVDSEFIVYWKGRVASCKTSGDVISVECEPIFTSLRRPGLRARWQRSCRYALYHRGCGLDPEDFGSDGTCTTVDGVNIVVTEAAALPAGSLVGGMLKAPDGVLRYIMAHSGSSLKLIRPVAYLQQNIGAGSIAVRLYPGCDHTRQTCHSKFNNLPNYGGFPWIPNKNPMGGSSIL